MKSSGLRWFVERRHWTVDRGSELRRGSGFAAVLQEDFLTAEWCVGQQ